MDRDTMIAEVRRRLGEDTADFWADTDIIRNLDMAVQHFSHEEDWPWLYTVDTSKTLDTGLSTVTLPADIDYNRAWNIRLTSGTEHHFPERVTPSEGMRLETQFTGTGCGRYYYLAYSTQSAPGAGDETLTATVNFIPAADKTYSVKFMYIRRPAALTSGTQEPDVPEDFQPAIVAWATGQLWLHELVGHDVKAGEQMSIYASYVDKARREKFKLAPDERLIWGKEEPEPGFDGPFRLPDTYGRFWWH